MELRQLRLLLNVIECGGYAQAGKLLHVSHSAIHRQIRLLERELECSVLVRSGRAVRATEAGELLSGVARQIHQELEQAQRHVNDLNNMRTGNLRIGTTSSILVSFLPGVLQCFSKRFPGVRFQVETGIADDLIEEAMKGKLDLAIVFNPADLSRPLPELQIETLYREEFDWAVGSTHPLARRDRISLSQLVAYPLITLPPKSHLRRACDRVFAKKGLVPTVITELEHEEAIDKLIEINMGFALRSRRRPANAKIRCFSIPSGAVECDVGIVLHKRNSTRRATIEFIRMCRESAAPFEPAPESKRRIVQSRT